MRNAIVGSVFLLFTGAIQAAPVIPGTVHEVAAPGDKITRAMPNDVVQIHIPNPALAKTVTDVDVAVSGDTVLAGVANTVNPKGPFGGGRITIFVGLKGEFRSGTVTYSYKDGAGKEHKGKVTIQVTKE